MPTLDQAPAITKVRIAIGQVPNGVQVVGQNTYRDGFERVLVVHPTVRETESIHFIDQQVTRPVGESYREKNVAPVARLRRYLDMA